MVNFTEMQKILPKTNFDVDVNNSRLGISISSDMMYISVKDYNEFIDKIPLGIVAQNKYFEIMHEIKGKNVKFVTAKRLVRQLRWFWNNYPQFGIRDVEPPKNKTRWTCIECFEKVFLDFNTSHSITEYFEE